MRTRRFGGMVWLAAVLLLAGLVNAPGANAESLGSYAGWRLPINLAAAQTPMEAQMLGEQPFQTRSAPQTETSFALPHNLKFRISVHYNQAPAVEPARPESSLLFKYSMDYRLLPNLKVGLNGYLYRRDAGEGFSFSRPLGDKAMGFGPGIQYDLGRWSFMLRSQVESNPRGEDLQNWFRVWYAF